IDRAPCLTLAERMMLATDGNLPHVASRSMVVSMHGQTAPDIATHGGEPRRLLSVDDVGRTLGGITRRQVYRMLDSGELESVKLGRRRLVPADAVDALINRLRNSSKQPPRPAQPPSRPPAQPAPAPPPTQPPRRQHVARGAAA